MKYQTSVCGAIKENMMEAGPEDIRGTHKLPGPDLIIIIFF